jgi:hypothetical protein
MANRIFDTVLALQKQIAILDAEVTIGSSGAVTAIKGSGIASVANTGTGLFTVTLEDSYNKLLSLESVILSASANAICTVQIASVTPDVNLKSAKTLAIRTLDFAGAAANPASATVIKLLITLRKSSVKGKGE